MKGGYILIFKKHTFILLAKIVFLLNIAILSSLNFTSVSAKQLGERTILIDPGHGGRDPGAVSRSGTLEKNINLSISKILKAKLIAEGFNVVMTREDDKELSSKWGSSLDKKRQDLGKRSNMKVTSGSNLFISIHCNMTSDPSCRGAEVWYSKNKESEKIAEIIQENFKKDIWNNTKRDNRAAKDKYRVLRGNLSVPSILVECGFISNYNDEQNLKSKTYQNRIAASITRSVVSYFDNKDQEGVD